MEPLPTPLQIVIIGAGATALMDLWLALLERAGIATLDLAMLGRWTGHLVRGRVAHDAIRSATPIPAERLLGWVMHYAIGIAFAAMLVAAMGAGWLRDPAPLPAITFGLMTVAAPLLVMQPAMGAGIASSRTPAPLKNSLRSVANHAVFGLGLYLCASASALFLA